MIILSVFRCWIGCSKRDDHSKRETKSTEKTLVKTKAPGDSKKIKPIAISNESATC